MWGRKPPGPPCSRGRFSKAVGEFLSRYQLESPIFQEWTSPRISAELGQGLEPAQWEAGLRAGADGVRRKQLRALVSFHSGVGGL